MSILGAPQHLHHPVRADDQQVSNVSGDGVDQLKYLSIFQHLLLSLFSTISCVSSQSCLA